MTLEERIAAFASAVGIDIKSLQSKSLSAFNRLIMPLATSSAVPPANSVALAARKTAGRMALSFMDPDGNEAEIQAALWGNIDIVSGGSNAFGGFGASVTATGSVQANQTPANTSYRSSLPRYNQTTGTTAGTAAGVRFGTNSRWRGNAAGLGGFYIVFRNGLNLLTGHQAFIGLAPTNVLAGEPSAVASIFGIGCDSTDTNLQFMTRTGSGTVSKTDLGVVKTSIDVFRVTLYCPPFASYIWIQVWNETTSALVYEAQISNDLPANNVMLAPQAQIRNGTTVTSGTIDTMKIISMAPTR